MSAGDERSQDDATQGQLERSHIAQWCELTQRAANFDMVVHFEWNCFRLQARSRIDPNAWVDVKTCQTLFELRAAISDHVAERRRNGDRV